jgi:uncharacterized protein (DUF849 family)
MAPKVAVEAALNGNWDRRRQPLVPLTVAELIADGIACAEEGAAIIHFHARGADEATYLQVIDGIRAKHDVIVYPVIDDGRSELRTGVVDAVARHELLEWWAVDPGSVNIAPYGALHATFTYVNSIAELRAELALCAQRKLRPTYAIYEPGFLRLGAALAAETPGLKPPLYRLMFSDGMTFGMPPREYALRAYLSLLEDFAPGADWMVAGYMVDPMPLIPALVASRGHVRVGLEDAPLRSERSNAQWVAHAVAAIASAGGELATATELRAAG